MYASIQARIAELEEELEAERAARSKVSSVIVYVYAELCTDRISMLNAASRHRKILQQF
jgi:hypothetical protein